VSIKFYPSKFIAKVAPAKKIEKVVRANLTMKQTAFKFLEAFDDILDVQAVTRVALKTLKGYRARVKADPELEAGDLVDDPAQLVQRVQNEITFQIHDEIKDRYAGEFGVWLPSSAEEPRPEHQLNYGKTYQIGVGIDGVEPGDEYGCQCGVEILVDGSSLDL
jgi:hypothetical protein